MHSPRKNQNGAAAHPLLPLAAAAALAVGIFLLYSPALNFDFTNYDEQDQVVKNSHIRDLGRENVKWFFTNLSMSSYYPIRAISFAVDFHFWELEPKGYHLTNILIHVANVLLLYGLILRLLRATARPAEATPIAVQTSGPSGKKKKQTKRKKKNPKKQEARWKDAGTPKTVSPWHTVTAVLGAAFFAVHPVVVESVMWVAAREEVLMTFFGLACLHFHFAAWPLPRPESEIEGTNKRNRTGLGKPFPWRTLFLVPAVVCCALACRSNAVAAIIPLFILAWDLVLGEKASVRGGRATGAWFAWLAQTGLLWLVSLATFSMKVWPDKFHAKYGIPGNIEVTNITNYTTEVVRAMKMGFSDRCLTVLNCYYLNLKALVWPRNLSLKYPNAFPEDYSNLFVIFTGLFLIALTFAVLWLLRKNKILLFGCLWFLLALLPSSQIVKHHIFHADRFLYLPMVGLALMFGFGVGGILSAAPSTRRQAAGLGACVLLLALTVGARRQTMVWENNITVWTHAVESTENNVLAHNNLGSALSKTGKHLEGIEHFKISNAIDPTDIYTHNHWGNALEKMGRLAEGEEITRLRDEALEHFLIADRNRPDDWEINSNLGAIYNLKKDYEQAEKYLLKSLKFDPNNPDTLFNTGVVTRNLGKIDEARQYFIRATQINPSHFLAHYNLGLLCEHLGETDQAAQSYTRGLAATEVLKGIETNINVLQEYETFIEEFRTALERVSAKGSQ